MRSSAAEYFRKLSPLKGGNMYEKDGYNGRLGRCHCCPYGYHIDLDFVRYCQALNQGAKNDNPALIELKRRRKTRRRQTKSMEAMLGISAQEEEKTLHKGQSFTSYGITSESKSPVPPPREKKKTVYPPSPPPRLQSLTHPALRSPPPPDIINSSTLIINRRNEAASDALQEAVMDFEEILESSKEQPRRKSRYDTHQPYSTIDLLHHTQPQSSHSYYLSKSYGKPLVATVARSNSLPRQFLHDSSTSFSRQPYYPSKESFGMAPSYPYVTNGYAGQSPLISDALAALNAAQGLSANRVPDMDTMSVTSAMSGVSTTTLQSIRDQMATGLSRLKELEEEVKGIPEIQTKMEILIEEKLNLLEQLRYYRQGQEPPHIPFSLERDYATETNMAELEARLETLQKFNLDERRGSERKRSLSPMRVNLQDFHSYRRARRGSLSEGSDTESVHSFKGRDKSGDREETRLYITEVNDLPIEKKKSSYSLPGTPMLSRRHCKDAAVSCKVLTRDVGVSYVAPRSRSIGTVTDKVDDTRELDRRREIKAKPCLQCFKRSQKIAESRSVGTCTSKEIFGHLSVSSLSNNSIGPDEMEIKSQDLEFNSKNVLLQKLGKKSPIISRLSSPQLFPPTLTFDNSTNTEPLLQKDQRINTYLGMDDLFTREQLNELIEDSKKQWEAAHKSKLLNVPKEHKKPFTSERGMQTIPDLTPSKIRPLMQNASVMVKPSTRDSGIGFSSINVIETRSRRSKSIGCGSESPLGNVIDLLSIPKLISVGVSDHKITDILCSDCIKKNLKSYRSAGSGEDRISDLLCDKCSTVTVRSVGVGDFKITDEICKKCKLKRTSNSSCQAQPTSRTVAIEVNLPPPSREASVATTPEVERRPFGSSGVRICDKCHEAITSVAKDIVSITGPTSTATINVSSKIPRLVEQKSPPKSVTDRPTVSVVMTQHLDLKEDIKSVDLISTTSSFSMKSEKPFFRTEEKLLLKQQTLIQAPKTEALSSSSSVVSSSLPSISGSPLVKRVPYSRQETYTKVGDGNEGFVNLAFEEQPDKVEVEEEPKIPLARKESPEKPKREKSPKETDDTAKDDVKAVIKGKPERKSSSSLSSSSASSSDNEDVVSIVTSSVATEEPVSLQASADAIGKPRKKASPSRGMKAALKVLNDSIGKPVRSGQQLNNAINIIQKEWFKVSSQKDADPLAVEDYMDAFEEYSKGLLQRVVNLSDINGNTAMHYAVSHGNFDVVSVLLNSKVCNINYQNKAGYTAIMLVALAQIRNDAHESVVRKLFESGDVNIKASQHGQTALMLAVSHGRLDMVRMLIATGANPNIQDEDGSTALMCSAEHGHLAIVRYLVAQPDTDLFLMDNDGSTALTIAVEAGHKDVGVLLYKQMNLSRGSSPYSSVRGGKRPRTPTLVRSSITPPPRNSAPSSPGQSRKSSGTVSPPHTRQSSASLSNLIL